MMSVYRKQRLCMSFLTTCVSFWGKAPGPTVALPPDAGLPSPDPLVTPFAKNPAGAHVYYYITVAINCAILSPCSYHFYILASILLFAFCSHCAQLQCRNANQLRWILFGVSLLIGWRRYCNNIFYTFCMCIYVLGNWLDLDEPFVRRTTGQERMRYAVRCVMPCVSHPITANKYTIFIADGHYSFVF